MFKQHFLLLCPIQVLLTNHLWLYYPCRFEAVDAENLVCLLNNHIRWLKEQHSRELRQAKEQFNKEKCKALEIVTELNSCWGYNKLPIRGCACASYTRSCDNCNTVLEKYVKAKCGELIELLQPNN